MELVPNPTTPPRAEIALNAIQTRRDAVLNELRHATIESFHNVWNNKDGIPPAEILACMGTSAVAAFQEHATTVEYLALRGLEIEPADCMPPLAFTGHGDGTITLD